MWALVREQLAEDDGDGDNGTGAGTGTDDGTGEIDPQATKPKPDPIIKPAQRYLNVSINVPGLPISKTQNLHPYLFKVPQEIDVDAEVSISIQVTSNNGLNEETLNSRIVEGLDMLDIQVDWEPE